VTPREGDIPVIDPTALESVGSGFERYPTHP
jgi:hypothetical protein